MARKRRLVPKTLVTFSTGLLGISALLFFVAYRLNARIGNNFDVLIRDFSIELLGNFGSNLLAVAIVMLVLSMGGFISWHKWMR